MDNRKEMIQKAKEILNYLDFAKKEADSFISRLPNSIDKKLKCALWYRRFSSVLSKKQYKKEKMRVKVLKSIFFFIHIVDCISTFLSKFVRLPKKYQADFLFLYGCDVHRDIVKDLVLKLKEKGLKVVEIEEHTLNKVKKIEHLTKGIKYVNIHRDIRSLLISNQLYLSFVNYLGVIVPHMPRIMISFNESSQAAGLISYICKLIGSKSINIAHAISVKTPLFINSPYDYHLVYGEKSKQNIEEGKGLIDGKIIPIGALKMDKLFLIRQNNHNNKFFTKNILIVGSWKGHFLDEVVEYEFTLLSEFVRNNKDFIFLYKKHPLEIGERDHFSKKFCGISNCFVLPPDSDLVEALQSGDIVILGWSAVGLEAAILGKPVIVFNPCKIPDWLSYTESGYGLEVFSIEELNEAINKVYDNYNYYKEKAKKFADIHLSNQGNATDKTYKFLLSILRESYKNESRLLAGKPLIACSIEAALTLKIDKVVFMGDEEIDEKPKNMKTIKNKNRNHLYMLNSYNWRGKNGQKH